MFKQYKMKNISYKRVSYDVSKFKNEKDFEIAMKPKLGFKDYIKVLKIFKESLVNGSISKRDKKTVATKSEAKPQKSSI